MTVSIITHAYGPFYITLLAQQLRSLAGRDGVTVSVSCWTDETHLISDAISDIDDPLENVCWRPLERQYLLNRAIDRNAAAKQSTDDWVWFTDCDYLFGSGAFESVAALDPHAACMYYPRTVFKSAHFFDDDPNADCERFDPSTQRKAIGGIQIVPGHIARQWGYLDGVDKYHRPAVGDKMYNPKEDHAYRRWLVEKTGLPIVAADIPHVYRLRHRIPDTSTRHAMLPMEG